LRKENLFLGGFKMSKKNEEINSDLFYKQNKQNTAGLDYFFHIREIGKMIRQAGGLTELFYEFAKPHLEIIGKDLEIDHLTASLFSALINLSNGNDVTVTTLANYLNIDFIEIMSLMEELENLEYKGLININKTSNDPFSYQQSFLTFKLPYKTIDVLRKGDLNDLYTTKNLTIEKFFCQLDILFGDRVNKHVSYENSIRKMNDLLSNNQHLAFIQKIQNLELEDNDLFVLLRFFHYEVNNDCSTLTLEYMSAIYDKSSDRIEIKRKIKNKQYILLVNKLIEQTCDNGFSNTDEYQLTNDVKEYFLEDLDYKVMDTSNKNLKSYDSIAAKNLYYPIKTEQMINELSILLQPENFLVLQKNLSENSMRTGFACIFTGEPGTGKTETVYQIARGCKRNIMQVDISATKSKWFGDSEKEIKRIFDKYRACVRKSEVAPILLFNEADAVFAKRHILNGNSSSVGQTENAIQNIILQEIENLNGILIATTNLAVNMDAAFERRFLYKIEFEKPAAEIRKLLWQSIIPDLGDDDAHEIATRYHFSGGQIENIARKYTVQKVLFGNVPTLSEMARFCEEEVIIKDRSKRIGFAA